MTNYVSPLWIVLLEDDWQQAVEIREDLEHEFRDAKIEVFKNESSFRIWLEQQSFDPATPRGAPDVIILDMMVRYTDPDPNNRLESLVGVGKGTFFTAGAACYDELVKRGLGDRALIHTVADIEDLKRANLWEKLGKIHVQKQPDRNDDLIYSIRRLLSKTTDSHSSR